MKLSDEEIIKRYNKVRYQCMRYANIREDGKETCHQALKFARDVDGLSFSMAGLLDDMALAIRQLMEERGRYREALNRIASAEDHYEPCGWAILTAKQALEKDDAA